jgi:hypothetical protein
MPGRFFLCLALLTTAISIGCGGGSGTSHVPAGELAVSPSVLDFGKVAVGNHSGKTGTLTAGDSSITVTSADWSGEGYSVSGIVFPLTIRAGQSIAFNITFAPHHAGSSLGKISFQSDAESATKVAFSGRGTPTPTGTHSVTLSWTPAGATVIGYNIYRGMASDGKFGRVNSALHRNLTFTDVSVHGGETYFYMTTAVSQDGRESKYSNRVQVAIPNS